MKAYSEYLLLAALIGILAAMYFLLGHRVAIFSACLSIVWFFIIFVLMSRPPGIPEFVSDEVGSDEQHVIRKDVIPKFGLIDRLRLALAAACGASLILWVTLVVLGR
ncbi:MAG: hypothetical protein AAF483_01155 [Planctomycetota bacterium]